MAVLLKELVESEARLVVENTESVEVVDSLFDAAWVVCGCVTPSVTVKIAFEATFDQ